VAVAAAAALFLPGVRKAPEVSPAGDLSPARDVPADAEPAQELGLVH
jgi:hypothetical protein